MASFLNHSLSKQTNVMQVVEREILDIPNIFRDCDRRPIHLRVEGSLPSLFRGLPHDGDWLFLHNTLP